MVYATEVKIKPPWYRWFCKHRFTGKIRIVYDSKCRKRHARVCEKCGERKYID